MADVFAGVMRGASRCSSQRPTYPLAKKGNAVARQTDIIKHRSFWSALAGAVVGALVSYAIGMAFVAIIGVTGGWGIFAVMAVSGFLFSKVSSDCAEAVSNLIDCVGTPDGCINSGSPNVYAEGQNVARVELDVGACNKHSKPPRVAQGSETVFVNGKAIARKYDQLTCSAIIKSGAQTVYAGTGQETYLEIESAHPFWQRVILFAVDFLVPPGMALRKGLVDLLKNPSHILTGLIFGAKKAFSFLGGRIRCMRSAESFTEFVKKAIFGDPIDVISGSVIEQRTDFVIGNSLPLTMKRTYQTGYPHTGALGRRWADTLSECLILHEQDWIEIRTDEAESLWFYCPAGTGSSFNPKHPEYELLIFDNEYRLQYRSGLTKSFDKSLYFKHPATGESRIPVSRWQDAYVNRIDFQYDAFCQLHSVIHSDGPRLQLVWMGEWLQQVIRVDGLSPQTLVTYRQDDAGHLREADAIDAYRIWYDYNPRGWMTRWDDHQSTWVTYEYDDQGRCIRSTGADGYYDVVLAYESGLTRAYNARRELTVYTHEHDRITSVTVDGAITRYEYDLYGNLLRETSPLGHVQHWQYLRDTGLVSTYTDAIGRQWLYSYDANGLLLSATNPAGQEFSVKRDRQGAATQFLSHDGRVAHAEYNQHGLIVRLVDDTSGAEHRYEYDQKQRLQGYFDECHRSTQLRYDQLDRLQSLSQADGAQWRLQREHNRRLRLIQPNGSSVNAVFDRQHNLTHYTDALGVVWQVDYGAFDLPLCACNADGRCVAVKVVDATLVTLAYDAAGQLLTSTV